MPSRAHAHTTAHHRFPATHAACTLLLRTLYAATYHCTTHRRTTARCHTALFTHLACLRQIGGATADAASLPCGVAGLRAPSEAGCGADDWVSRDSDLLLPDDC